MINNKSLLLIAIITVSLFPLSSGYSDITPYLFNEETNTVYIDDSKVFISCYPAVSTGGYVYINFTSKVYDGEINFAFGVDSEIMKPKSMDIWNIKEDSYHVPDRYFDDPIYYKYNVSANILYLWTKLEFNEETNSTIILDNWILEFQHYYDRADVPKRTIYWNVPHWKSVSNENFNKISFNYGGMSTWHITDFEVQSNVNYYARIWLDVTPSFNLETSKYWVAFWPSSEGIVESINNNHFYALDPWYDSDWNYRKNHTINSATGAETNYNIPITVYYGSGSDSGQNVYLDSKCQTDFDDIRFTDDDGSTLLNHWLQEKIDSDQAHFWVEISDNLSSSNQLIYLYYNNSAATSTSNFDNTFIFGDPFDSEILDTGKWPTVNGSQIYSIDDSNHYLEITDSDEAWGTNQGFYSSIFTMPPSWIIEDAYSSDGMGIYQDSSSTNDVFATSFSLISEKWVSNTNEGVSFYMITDSWVASLDIIRRAGVGGTADWDSGAINPGYPVTYDVLMWKLNGNIHIKENSTEQVNETNSESPDQIALISFKNTGDTYGTKRFYAFKIRKYVSPEPTQGSWGDEEEGKMIMVQYYTVTDSRVNISDNVNIDVTLHYLSDDAPVIDGIVNINGISASHQGEGTWRITQSQSTVQGVTYNTVTASGNSRGSQNVDQNNKFQLVIWDRLNVTQFWASNYNPPIGETITLYAIFESEYDSHLCDGDDSITIENLDFTYDPIEDHFFSPVTKTEDGTYYFDTLNSIYENTYGIGDGNLDYNISIIWGGSDYYLYGLFHENGTSAGNVTINVHPTDEFGSFTLDKTTEKNYDEQPLMISWVLAGGGTRRIYLISSNETHYIFAPYDEYMSYSFPIKDYSGVVGSGTAHLESYLIINGTERLIERALIRDTLNPTSLLLQKDLTYRIQIRIVGGAVYDQGYFTPSVEPPPTFIIEEVEWGDQIHYVGQYVAISFSRPEFEHIKANYKDELEETTSILFEVCYINGTQIWNATSTEQMIQFNKYGLNNETDYLVKITAQHTTFGQITHQAWLPGETDGFEDLPDFDQIGTGATKALAILLIFSAFMLTSRLNGYLGIFLATAVAYIVRYTGFLPELPYTVIHVVMALTIMAWLAGGNQ